MLCIIFGVMIAALTYNWLGNWAALAGVIAAAALYLGMKFWPVKSDPAKSDQAK